MMKSNVDPMAFTLGVCAIIIIDLAGGDISDTANGFLTT